MIDTKSTPCWVVVDATGFESEYGDGVPHYSDEAEATGAADDRTCDAQEDADEGVTVEPFKAQLHQDAPCVMVSCDGSDDEDCGYVFDEDEYVMHFDSPADAKAAADDANWVIRGDGKAYCSEHGCAVAGHLWHERFGNPGDWYCRRCYRDRPLETAHNGSGDVSGA